MKGTRLFWQTILVVAFAAVGTLFAAQRGDALKIQGDFKHWYLVHSTLITKDDNKLGLIAGVHLIYVNAAGLDRLKRAGRRHTRTAPCSVTRSGTTRRRMVSTCTAPRARPSRSW
jgi:hypothetical protein